MRHLPPREAGERLVLGVDASSIPRPDARTAPGRTLVHVADVPRGVPPVRPGRQFSAVVALPAQPSSWVYSLDTAAGVAAAQLRALLPTLPERPVVLLDANYGTLPWLRATADLGCDQLVRLSPARVFSRPAPPPPARSGGSWGSVSPTSAARHGHRDPAGNPPAARRGRWSGAPRATRWSANTRPRPAPRTTGATRPNGTPPRVLASAPAAR